MNIFHITFYCIFPKSKHLYIDNFFALFWFIVHIMLQIKIPANSFGQKKEREKERKGRE